MARTINMSPTKLYVMLFALVVVAYGAFIIIKSVKTGIVEVEHFVEENPDYKYRLEVMKVFDLYLNRNPTSEEIQKYAAVRNEQDILLAILKDFNISASDVDQAKLAKYNSKVQVEEEFNSDLEAVTENIISRGANDTANVNVKIDEDVDVETFKKDENLETNDGADMIKIPREKLNEIKGHLKVLCDYFATLG